MIIHDRQGRAYSLNEVEMIRIGDARLYSLFKTDLARVLRSKKTRNEVEYYRGDIDMQCMSFFSRTPAMLTIGCTDFAGQDRDALIQWALEEKETE